MCKDPPFMWKQEKIRNQLQLYLISKEGELYVIMKLLKRAKILEDSMETIQRHYPRGSDHMHSIHWEGLEKSLKESSLTEQHNSHKEGAKNKKALLKPKHPK